jgi:glycosyltransferase involved in cell wall biosynthesis
MASERPLLTIAIPTYNRSRYLARLLAALDSQMADDSRIELLISDNHSSDNTPEVVASFQSNRKSCRYLRNETNIGSDANFLQCFESAAGKYVWLFGDDDLPEPGSLMEILSILSSEEYDLVHLSVRNFKGEYSPPHKPFRGRSIAFHRAEDLARRVHVSFTFITANIVNKERVSAVEHPSFRELLGTGLVQLGWVYTALEHHRRSLLVCDRLIAAQTENTGGYQLCKVFGPNLKAVSDRWLTSQRVKQHIVDGTLQMFLPACLLGLRENSGVFLSEDPHAMLHPVFGRNLRYWIFDFPMVRLPVAVAKRLLFALRVVNKLDRMTGNRLFRFSTFG